MKSLTENEGSQLRGVSPTRKDGHLLALFHGSDQMTNVVSPLESESANLASLMVFGTAVLTLALVLHGTALRWQEALLTITGAGVILFASSALYVIRAREILLAVMSGYIGMSLMALAFAAHQLRIGHNPALRWAKALLLIGGVNLTLFAVRLLVSSRPISRLCRDTVVLVGGFAVTVAIAVHPLGLAADPAFHWKRELLFVSGVCMIGLGIFYAGVLRAQEWLTGSSHAIVDGLAAIPTHCRNTIVLLSFPWIIMLVNPNWTFQSLGSMDPWYYFGAFIHFPHYQRLLPLYPDERLMWILPGYLMAHIFTPAYGVIVLAVLFYSVSVLCVYYVVNRFSDSFSALVAAAFMACHPFFIGANGWSYVDGPCIAYFLLTVAFIVKAASSPSRIRYTILAGIWWASLTYTYLLWIVLSPCFFYLYYRLYSTDRDRLSLRATCKELARFTVFFGSGAALLTLLLQTLHTVLGGTGFFFRNNIDAAFGIMSIKNVTPWASGNFHWLGSASWLVFPLLTFVLVTALLVLQNLRVIQFSRPAMTFAHIYLYSFGVLVLMTIRPTRLLEFDYYASMLIPSIFLVLGLTVFRVPVDWRGYGFYLIMILACTICILPLWKINLYRLMLLHGLGFICFLGAAGLLLRLVFYRRGLSWAVLLCTLSIVSFGLIPAYPGIAWVAPYDGLGSTERIASAIKLVENRLPRQEYPVFWINNFDAPFTSEYRAIMCSFLAHGISMWNYPAIAADHLHFYRPGTFLILITGKRDVFDDANANMTGVGLPLVLYGQDLVSAHGTSYWLTYVRVLQKDEHANRRSLTNVE